MTGKLSRLLAGGQVALTVIASRVPPQLRAKTTLSGREKEAKQPSFLSAPNGVEIN